MNRRKFISQAAVGGVVSAAAASQAIAQTPALPNIKWRLASSFPKSLDTIYGGAETSSKPLAAITGGKFQIQVFAAGEIVPAFSVVEAVQNGTVECSHTASYYFVGKNKAFAFDTTLPFGLTQRQRMFGSEGDCATACATARPPAAATAPRPRNLRRFIASPYWIDRCG